MLSEERLNKILSIVEAQRSATVQELAAALNASESTIRRALTALDSGGKLTKVFGGAIAKDMPFTPRDNTVFEREQCCREEKTAIARHAASLIRDDDFVYLDAGTTTGLIIDFITARKAVFVTNCCAHAARLAAFGLRTFIVGGEIKSATDAVIGEEALKSLEKYHFTKGFWGANGISCEHGLTTPDASEAMIKQTAMRRTRKKYVVADATKFSRVSCVTFADFAEPEIITAGLEDAAYSDCPNIKRI
ncbi:MAG: DeoR/GlpR family DNA-binding transcription regulator [Treponema sp.]